jgi:beta-glucanase (GH16 family)
MLPFYHSSILLYTALGNPGECPAGNYAGWHVFGASWLNHTVTFYYDGVNVGSATTVGCGMVANPVQDLNLVNAIGANGYSGPVVVPATMQVDYVRVWQLCTSNCTPQSTWRIDAGDNQLHRQQGEPLVGRWTDC